MIEDNVDAALAATEPALDDKGKAEVVAGFLGMLLDELDTRDIHTEARVLLATKVIRTCSAALEDMKNFPDPLTKKEAEIFVKAFSLGSVMHKQ